MILRVTIPDEPVPKGRPRFGNGHVFTPQQTRMAEDYVGWQVKVAWKREVDAISKYRVKLAFYTDNKRADVDNLAKLVLDGITRTYCVWADDKQVTKLECEKLPADGNPRTEIEIEEVDNGQTLRNRHGSNQP